MEEKPFWKHVRDRWVIVATGGGLAALISVATWFGLQPPTWLAWSILVLSVLLALYLAGKESHAEKLKLAERLKPKLSILDLSTVGETKTEFTVTIRNECDESLTFWVMLESIEPLPDYIKIPLPLRIANERPNTRAIIGPRAETIVYVLKQFTHPAEHVDLLAADIDRSIPKQRYDMVIAAYCVGGAPVRKSFTFVPELRLNS